MGSPARRRVPPARHGVLRVPVRVSPRGGTGGGEAVVGQAARPPAPMEGGAAPTGMLWGSGGLQGAAGAGQRSAARQPLGRATRCATTRDVPRESGARTYEL